MAYARAIGAEPLIQVPLLAGPDHLPATPDTAVSALTPAPATVTFTLPALSIAAVEIPDSAKASALVYGKVQHDAGGAPLPLEPGISPEALDGG